MQRPPPPTNRPNRPLLFTTQADSSSNSSTNSSQPSSSNQSQSSSSNSSTKSSSNSSTKSSTNSSVLSAAPTHLDLDYDSMDDWIPIQFNYLFNDTTVPNGPGTFVNLDTLPPPPPSPITPTQDNDEEPEEPEDTGAGIGA